MPRRESSRPLLLGQEKAAKPRIGLFVIPGEGKYNHLAFVRHRGGGWYDVQCMGSGKRCVAGECGHTADLAFKTSRSIRPLRQVPRRQDP